MHVVNFDSNQCCLKLRPPIIALKNLWFEARCSPTPGAQPARKSEEIWHSYARQSRFSSGEKEEGQPHERGTTMTPPYPSPPTDESFRLLVDAIDDYAIFMLDPLGRVVTWSAGAQKMKGYDAGEIIGQHVSIFHTPADLAAKGPETTLTYAAANGRVENEGWRHRLESVKRY